MADTIPTLLGPITQVDTTALYPLGVLYQEPANNDPAQAADASQGGGGRLWRYIKNGEASSAFAAGDAIISKSGTSKAQGILGSAVTTARCIGAAQHAIAAGSYGWVLVEGVGEGTVGAGGAQNVGLVLAASADFNGAAAITDSVVGYQIDSGSSATVTCYFCIPR